MSTQHFYSDLSINQTSLSKLFDDETHFAEVPADWHVIVTDIKNSTVAFRAGRSEEINLIATGCIIAVLNLAQKQGVDVPFFFGGDGATLLVPSMLLEASLRALRVHKANTKTNFDLELRVGSVSVGSLKEDEHRLSISRIAVSEIFSIPIILGDGLAEAERRVKGKSNDPEDLESEEIDLTGMECRWDKIKPASSADEVVCLLVSVSDLEEQARIFGQVIAAIDNIYGPYQQRNPVSKSGLAVKSTFGKIALEMKARLGKNNLSYLLKNWLITSWGRLFYFKQPAGQYYMEKLVELTDTLVIDGRINTVIAGKRAQRLLLEESLNKMEAAGKIVYGLFVSSESIMSCYVRDRKDKHIHFVDGADGGYTMAATVWKRKLRNAG